MFFDNWFGLLRILVVAPLAYIALIALIRLTGKRSLAKLNAFDMVVTVALGSTLASVVLSSSVALLEGILGFTVLLGLQFIVAWLSVRSDRFESLVKADPTLLFFNGKFLDRVMKRERIARDELLALLRAEGIANFEEIKAVILETDGSFSVIDASNNQKPLTSAPVEGIDAAVSSVRS